MSAKTQINKIKTLLGMEVNLEQMKLENGTVLEAESFESGAEVFIVNEEDRIPVPMGEYEMEDGKILIIEEDGIISEIKEEAEEEVEVEIEAEKEEMEYATKQELAEVKEMIEEIKAMLEPKESKEEKEEMSKEPIQEVEEPKEEVELSAQSADSVESVEPLKHNPEGSVSKKELNLFAQKRAKTTRDIVFSKLFK